ncbi:MAG: hypothetical protein WC729_29935 [Sphingomonas sp.]|jgi:hypothetical protein|uniref:hypothetical protein n=1 Tax=Sphingomonas sp. TaxID=28214 RepID=UPI00356B4515
MRTLSLARLTAVAATILSLGAFSAPQTQPAPTAPTNNRDAATLSDRAARLLTRKRRVKLSGDGSGRRDKGYYNGRGDWCTPKRDTKRWLRAHGIHGKGIRQFRKMQQRRFSAMKNPSAFAWAVRRARHFLALGLPAARRTT